VKVAILVAEEYATEPATGFPMLSRSRNVEVFIVDWFMSALNAAATVVVTATSAAPAGGEVLTTAGRPVPTVTVSVAGGSW
jgi:hypothetical protein